MVGDSRPNRVARLDIEQSSLHRSIRRCINSSIGGGEALSDAGLIVYKKDGFAMTSELQTKALDALATARKFYGDFAAQLTEAQRNEKGEFVPYESWSAKDVIGHLSHSDEGMTTRLEVTGRGETFERDPDFNASNAVAYQKRHDWTWTQIWDENIAVMDRLEKFINGASDEVLKGLDERPPVWQQIQNATLLHGSAHLSDYWLSPKQMDRSEAVYETIIAILDATRGADGSQTAVYNKACLYAKTGAKDKAIPLLTQVLEKRPDLRDFSKEDTDLVLLHQDADYLALLERLTQPA